jgi:AcrR family transcriptional regulator
MYRQGVAATTLDQLIEVGGISKSQLYHYFADKDELVNAVASIQARRILASQQPQLEEVDSMSGLEQWANTMVVRHREGQRPYGCPLGSLANELAATSADLRLLLDKAFQAWESHLSDALRRIRGLGELDPRANPDDIATGVMATIQGGYLLAQTAEDERPFELALQTAMRYVRSYLASNS